MQWRLPNIGLAPIGLGLGLSQGRDVAQPGSASHWGCGGRRFESYRPDQFTHYIIYIAVWQHPAKDRYFVFLCFTKCKASRHITQYKNKRRGGYCYLPRRYKDKPCCLGFRSSVSHRIGCGDLADPGSKAIRPH